MSAPPSPQSVPPQPRPASAFGSAGSLDSSRASEFSTVSLDSGRPDSGRPGTLSVSSCKSATVSHFGRLGEAGTNVAAAARTVARETRINAKAAKAAAKAAAKSAQVPAHAQSLRNSGRGLPARSMSKRRSISGFMSPGLSLSSPRLTRLGGSRTSSGKENSRSAAASEGIALLKRGCVATKYTKKGWPRRTKFKLTEDETALTWEGNSCAVIKLGLARRVLMADAVEVLVGGQSAVFARHRQRAAAPSSPRTLHLDRHLHDHVAPQHLSLSLVMLASLPLPPSEMGDGGTATIHSSAQRETLDISLDGEEDFGLWVAAMRALLNETRVRPQPYPSPMAPLHASASASIRRPAPSDATLYEKGRDRALIFLDDYAKVRARRGGPGARAPRARPRARPRPARLWPARRRRRRLR